MSLSDGQASAYQVVVRQVRHDPRTGFTILDGLRDHKSASLIKATRPSTFSRIQVI
ncbi:hypothetical protein [Methylobacterium sp. SD21]|uniref:hypothetical protein n=1 Tax=Methylobacterium litchii TaxID=3138810 RepID=UPI00313BFEAB